MANPFSFLGLRILIKLLSSPLDHCSKVKVVVYAGNYIPLRMIYYDEDLLLSRTLEFTNIQKMDGKMIPTLMSMIPADEPGESTTIKWEEIKFDVAIDDEFFSLRKLQQ